MSRTTVLVGLVVSLAAATLGSATAGGAAPVTSQGNLLMVTGMILARDGAIVTMKTDGGVDYIVNAQDAAVMLDQYPGNALSLRVGDRIRVYGDESMPNRLAASRVHVFLTSKEAAVTHIAAGTGAGPAPIPAAKPAAGDDDSDVRLPSVGDSLGRWRSRGLVVDIHYRDRLMTVATSRGTYLIDVSASTLAEDGRSVRFAAINQGDAVRIWGETVGLNKVRADRVEIIREKNQQEVVAPLKPVSITGQIVSIDYPSFTFNLDTGTGQIRVLSDDNTFIHFGVGRKAFQDLTLGQTVKISGIGNLSSGYVASEIQVVGAPRE